jgi:hypothetical protein
MIEFLAQVDRARTIEADADAQIVGWRITLEDEREYGRCVLPVICAAVTPNQI